MAEPRSIVLLGCAGAGKSSLANTIFEDNVFEVNDTPNPAKRSCVCKDKRLNDRALYLIDTADYLDPKANDINHEIHHCLVECAPGIHALLLVLKVERLTSYNADSVDGYVDFIIKHFSKDALQYTTVVFTHGEDLPENMKIEEWVKQNEALESVVKKCGGRCHVFDNKHWNNNQDLYRNNQHQVTELLKTIDEKVRNNGEECYTNKTLEKLEEEIKQEMKRIRKAPGKKRAPKQQIRAEAKDNIIKRRSGWSVHVVFKYAAFIVVGVGVGVVAVVIYKKYQGVAKPALQACYDQSRRLKHLVHL